MVRILRMASCALRLWWRARRAARATRAAAAVRVAAKGAAAASGGGARLLTSAHGPLRGGHLAAVAVDGGRAVGLVGTAPAAGGGPPPPRWRLLAPPGRTLASLLLARGAAPASLTPDDLGCDHLLVTDAAAAAGAPRLLFRRHDDLLPLLLQH